LTADQNSMNSIKIKETLFKHADTFFGEAPVLFAYLYGSYAIDQPHPFSDLDIAIYIKKHLTARENMKLEMNLSLEIDNKFPVGPSSDVRTINYLPLAVAGSVITEGVLIYCIDDNTRIDFEMNTRRSYFDFLPFIKNYQRMYLAQIHDKRT
jgi:predicted nucleotidyltransferase